MKPVRIYYECDEPEQVPEEHISIASKTPKTDNEKRWHPSPRMNSVSLSAVPDEKIVLFPDAEYGEYENDLREVESRYNMDHELFQLTGYDAPELIPSAEQLQDTLNDLLNAAALIFDKFGRIPGLQDRALEIMNRICKDSYAIGEKVSKHVKYMSKQFPDDEVLHEDLKEIDESFTDFYLEAYSMMVKYRKKNVSE